MGGEGEGGRVEGREGGGREEGGWPTTYIRCHFCLSGNVCLGA